MTTLAQNTHPAWPRALGWIVSLIFFSIGFYQTGIGLSEFQVLGLKYGSFVASFGVFSILLISYKKAIDGSRIALMSYISFALVNVVCNFNSFYPNYMAKPLILSELKEHRQAITKLSEDIDATFSDAAMADLKNQIEAKSDQIQEQIKHGGFGPRAEQDLNEIEKLLNTRITRLKTYNSSPLAFAAMANTYARLIQDALNAKLASNRNAEKQELINFTKQSKDLAVGRIDTQLVSLEASTLEPPFALPPTIDQVVRDYQAICTKALKLADQYGLSLSCNPEYTAINSGLGKFTHTFKSAAKHFADPGTIIVFLICFMIDFIVPMTMYTLLASSTDSSSSLWDFLKVTKHEIGRL